MRSKSRRRSRFAIRYAIETLFVAGIVAIGTQGAYTMYADEGLIWVFIWNIVIIVIVLATDRLVTDALYSDKAVARVSGSRWASAYWRMTAVLGYATPKPGLYLFYLVALVAGGISAAQPGLFSDDLASYLTTVQAGLILLVASDKFIEVAIRDYAASRRLARKLATLRRQPPSTGDNGGQTTS